MKLCFSTLGCPEWTWNDILSTAKDLGYNGIEIRGVGNEMFAPFITAFKDKDREVTIKRLKGMGLEISCLTSFCQLFDEQNKEKNYNECVQYIVLAAKMEVPYIRVLGDIAPMPGETVNEEFVKKSLEKWTAYAKEKKVCLLVESNGIYADSKKLANLMKDISSEFVGVLWDIHHPARFFNEDIEYTYYNLKPYIKHVHIKDSIMINKEVEYKMTGQGDIPVEKALRLLNKNSYDGYVSLEWVKRWCSSLEAPGVVLPQFISYITSMTEI